MNTTIIKHGYKRINEGYQKEFPLDSKGGKFYLIIRPESRDKLKFFIKKNFEAVSHKKKFKEAFVEIMNYEYDRQFIGAFDTIEIWKILEQEYRSLFDRIV